MEQTTVSTNTVSSVNSHRKGMLCIWSHLENQEVPGLDQNAKFFQLFAIIWQTHNFAVDPILRRRTCNKTPNVVT